MLRLAFDFIITWRETRTRPNAYPNREGKLLFKYFPKEICYIGKYGIYLEKVS